MAEAGRWTQVAKGGVAGGQWRCTKSDRGAHDLLLLGALAVHRGKGRCARRARGIG